MQKKLKHLIYLGSVLLIIYTLQSCCLSSKLRSSRAYKSSKEAMMAVPYVAIQAKMNYKAEGKRYTGQVKIHIHRGHRIWASILHKWGVEVFRCNITSAGIEVINRMKKSYQFYDYGHLQTDWRVPCSYDLIQAVLLGIFPDEPTSSELLSDSTGTIRQLHGNYICIGTFDKHLEHLIKLCIADTVLGDRWSIFYKYNRGCQKDLLFSEADAFFALFNCTLEYQKVQFLTKPLPFPFNRPQ